MFKRKRNTTENKLHDKVAARIAGSLLGMQTRFSNRMNRLKNLKVLVILFCVFSGSLSLFFITEAILTVPKKQIKIDPIRILQHFDQPADTVIRPAIPADIFQQIQAYKRHMDSIGETIRPGLLDSMQVLEEIYSEQQ